MTKKFIKFPSIEKFSDVNTRVKRMQRFNEVGNKPVVHYKGKVKLHGTNASLFLYKDGEVKVGKRSGFITPLGDNAGFAAYIETVKDVLPKVDNDIAIFGEWAGPGIQKKVAISSIPQKTFFVFSILLIEEQLVVIDPEEISKILGSNTPFEVIPWAEGADFVVDFNDQSSLESFKDSVNQLVIQCDKVDPYVKDRYGIEGIGEGYVFTAIVDQNNFGTTYSDFIFKAKGGSHTVAAHETRGMVVIEPEVLESIEKFVSVFVSEDRLIQGLNEACEGTASTKTIGAFMSWIGQDVKKESVNELEASNLTWKDVTRFVNQKARDWFMMQIERN